MNPLEKIPEVEDINHKDFVKEKLAQAIKTGLTEISNLRRGLDISDLLKKQEEGEINEEELNILKDYVEENLKKDNSDPTKIKIERLDGKIYENLENIKVLIENFRQLKTQKDILDGEYATPNKAQEIEEMYSRKEEEAGVYHNNGQ